MSRYIDADKMLKEYQETLCFNVTCSLCPFLDNIKNDTCQVEKWISEQPTADVVEVVRCKECTHKDYCSQNIAKFGKGRDMYENISYCSYGERRER